MDGVSRGEQLELAISGITSHGDGVGRHDGLAVFVAGALPGEQVRAEIITRKPGYAQAKLLAVELPHAQRVEPTCPLHQHCGGCGLLHADYPLQLELKRQIVAQSLHRIAKLDIDVPLPLAAQRKEHYRCRAILHAEPSVGGWQFGFFSRAGRQLCAFDDCLLLRPALLELLTHIRAELAEHSYDLVGLRALALRCNSNENQLLLTLISDHPLSGGQALAEALIRREPRLSGVWENSGRPVYGEYAAGWQLLAGEQNLDDELAGLQLCLSPAAFTQVHPEQCALLYEQISGMASLQADDVLVDLYSGVGTIGLYLAGQVKQVIAVESYLPATADAIENARRNGVVNWQSRGGEAEDVLPRLLGEGLRPSVAVLDPPRNGCQPQLLDALATARIGRIIYTSCDPATLARDLRLLAEQGYQLEQVQPVDMFCHTPHIECVCLLAR